MSSTGRNKEGHERQEQDFYETPPWAVERLLDRIGKFLPAEQWLEPGAGGGLLIETVNRWMSDHGKGLPLWTAVEIREDIAWSAPPTKVIRGDFLEVDLPRKDFTVAITNPPYSLAVEFIARARKLADLTIMLLRVNFLASEKRHAWFRSGNLPDSMLVLPNRPQFVHGRGDSTEYAWYIWDEGGRLPDLDPIEVLDLTPKEVRQESNKLLAKRRERPTDCIVRNPI